MAMQTLDLDRLVDQPTVRIAGKEYPLYTIDLLPPLENYRVKRLMKRIDELAAKPELAETEETELGAILDKAVRIVLDAPEAVHKKLTDTNRMRVIGTFHVPSFLLKSLDEAAANPDPATAPTGSPLPTDSPAPDATAAP